MQNKKKRRKLAGREGDVVPSSRSFFYFSSHFFFFVVWLDGRLWPHPPRDISKHSRSFCSVQRDKRRSRRWRWPRRVFLSNWIFFSSSFSSPPPAPFTPSLLHFRTGIWLHRRNLRLFFPCQPALQVRQDTSGAARGDSVSPCWWKQSTWKSASLFFWRNDLQLFFCSPSDPHLTHVLFARVTSRAEVTRLWPLLHTAPTPLSAERERELIHFFNTTCFFSFSFELFSGFVLNLFCVFWGFLY